MRVGDGADGDGEASLLGPATREIDANEVIGDFFTEHPMPSITDGQD